MAQFAAPPQISPLAAANPLQDLLAGLQQGIALRQLPQQQEQAALNAQLAAAIQRAKLAQLEQPEIFNVQGNLVVRDPTAPNGIRSIFSAPTGGPSESFSLAGISNGQPIFTSNRSTQLIPGTAPQGLDLSEGLSPKVKPSETQTFVGYNPDGTPKQYGNRGSGLTDVSQTGSISSGPLQPKTQPAMRKGILLQDENGTVTYDVLSEGEAIPKGSKQFAEPKAADSQGLRKEFLSNDVVKDFTDIAPQYQRIQGALEEAKTTKNFTAVDQTLINTFNRILDPKSVVRESEYARTAEDQAIWQRLKGQFDSQGRLTVGGAGLSADTREAMARMAKRFYDAAQQNYTQTSAFYSSVAKNRGFDPSEIIPPIGGFQFNENQTAGVPPPAGAGGDFLNLLGK